MGSNSTQGSLSLQSNVNTVDPVGGVRKGQVCVIVQEKCQVYILKKI